MHATIGKSRIRAGHIKRRGVVGADGHRRRALRAFDPCTPSERCDPIEAHHARQADGRVVVRSHQRQARSHLAVELAFKVVRRVFVLRACAIGLLRVVEHGHWRKKFRLARQHRALNRGLERGRVDKRLENRSRWAMSHGVIHLRGSVATPTHQRQHLAGMRIERNECYLGIDVWLAELFVARVNGINLRVHDMNCRSRPPASPGAANRDRAKCRCAGLHG